MLCILPNRNAHALMRYTSLAVIALALATSIAGCKNESEAVPETGSAYYPVKVGNFWTYAATDTTWSQATYQSGQLVRSVVTISNYQLKETITETFADAAGNTAYRMVRARRNTAADGWRNDSVFVVSASPQYVAVNRNNVRTLELVFPVREGRSWNYNGFNNSSNDTISAETRQFSRIGQPFTTGGSRSGLVETVYPTTVSTNNTGTAAESNLLNLRSYQQVFAKTIGPVYRNRRRLLFYNYTDTNTGKQEFPSGSFSGGSGTHRETLIDYGPR
jgi:hypothetical protein